MQYIQYYSKSAISEELVQACGDRSVVILDGRSSLETAINEGYEFNGIRRPFYAAFRIFKGANFLVSKSISGLCMLPKKEDK